ELFRPGQLVGRFGRFDDPRYIAQILITQPQRTDAGVLDVADPQERVDDLDLLSLANDARTDGQARADRHRPEEVVRQPDDVHRHQGRRLLDRPRQERLYRTPMLVLRIPPALGTQRRDVP